MSARIRSWDDRVSIKPIPKDATTRSVRGARWMSNVPDIILQIAVGLLFTIAYVGVIRTTIQIPWMLVTTIIIIFYMTITRQAKVNSPLKARLTSLEPFVACVLCYATAAATITIEPAQLPF